MKNIDLVPKGWKVLNLKSITDSIQYGYTESASKEKIGPKFLRITDIQDNKVQWDDVPYCKINNEIKGKYLLKDGDLVFARTGATVGKSFLIKGDIPESVFASYLIRVRVNQEINEKYLSYFFHSPNYWSQITEGQVGIGQPNVNGTKLGQIKISIAPIIEQQAIVSKIEELLSDLENGRQQLLYAQQQLKVYRQSLLKWAFEGKLTMKDIKDGELPKDWKWVKNNVLLKYVTSGSRDWKQYYSSKGSRFVRTQDINSNKLDIENSAFVELPEKVEGKRSLIEESDILMTITGANVGKVAVVDFPIKDAYVSQSVALLKYRDKRITKYLWYYFQAQGFGKSYIDKLVYGVGRPVLSLENMREVDILICPIEDQQMIIEALESKLTVCDKIEETITQSLKQVETLRQSILKKAFEGKLNQ